MIYDTDCCILKEIPWRMCARVNQTIDYSLGLSFYLKCEIGFEERFKTISCFTVKA
jgi:hypothetical protein